MITKDFTYTNKFVIDERIYNGFIEIFKDKNPLHTDESFAKNKGFNSVVMHGNILNGIISYFVGEELPTKDVIIHMQAIKFLKPVYLNDVVELNVTVEEIYESVNSVAFNFYFTNQSAIKVAKGNVQIGILK